MATAFPTLRRSLLYIPSSSPKFLAKSLTLRADTLTYDLEDSVTPHQKSSARQSLAEFLSQPRPPRAREVGVRINAVDTGLALDDLTTILGRKDAEVDVVVVPKVHSASELRFVDDVIRHLRPSVASDEGGKQKEIKILALVESARALMDLNSICKASPLLDGLIFAAEDMALDLGITRTEGLMEFLYARSAVVTAVKAYGLSSAIDLVCTQFRGKTGLATLEEECQGGKGLGFNGKQCIHPSQVEIVERVFSPSEEEVEWAVRVVVGDEKASEEGRGAWTLEGKMIDAPVVGRARDLVKKAEATGIDVGSVRERWKDQEPE